MSANKGRQCTEVGFASFLSGGFTTMTVMNPPEKNLEKCILVQCIVVQLIECNYVFFTVGFTTMAVINPPENNQSDTEVIFWVNQKIFGLF